MTKFLQVVSFIAALAAGVWVAIPAMYHVLLVIIALDVITGTLHAIQDKKLSSEVAYTGILKKGGEIVLVGMAAYIQNQLPGLSDIPIGPALAGFYCYVEALSLVENAAALGVPIPQFLRDALIKLSPEKNIPAGDAAPVG